MDGDILISTEQMARGFARWDEAFRKNPREFIDHAVRIIEGETPSAYGKACADYFRSLLVEVK